MGKDSNLKRIQPSSFASDESGSVAGSTGWGILEVGEDLSVAGALGVFEELAAGFEGGRGAKVRWQMAN